MLTIAAAGAWSEARKFDAGMVESPVCPRCGLHDQDDLHMHWSCPALMGSKDPRVQKSNYLVYKAEWGAAFHPCFWLRGLVPKSWTHRPLQSNGWSCMFAKLGMCIKVGYPYRGLYTMSCSLTSFTACSSVLAFTACSSVLDSIDRLG